MKRDNHIKQPSASAVATEVKCNAWWLSDDIGVHGAVFFT